TACRSFSTTSSRAARRPTSPSRASSSGGMRERSQEGRPRAGSRSPDPGEGKSGRRPDVADRSAAAEPLSTARSLRRGGALRAGRVDPLSGRDPAARRRARRRRKLHHRRRRAPLAGGPPGGPRRGAGGPARGRRRPRALGARPGREPAAQRPQPDRRGGGLFLPPKRLRPDPGRAPPARREKPAAIGNSLRLLKLPDDIRELMRRGELTAGQARPLLGLETEEAQIALATRAVAERLSARELERL